MSQLNQLQPKVDQAVLTITDLVIVSQEDADEADNLLTLMGTAIKAADADRVEEKAPHKTLADAVDAKYRPIISRFTDAKTAVRNAIKTFVVDQEQKRLADQAEEDRKARELRERTEVRADAAEEKGHTEKADALESKAQTTAAKTVAPPVQSASTVKKVWKAEVTDKSAFLRSCADNPMFTNLVTVDQGGLNALARSLKENLVVNGCRVYQDTQIAARRG